MVCFGRGAQLPSSTLPLCAACTGHRGARPGMLAMAPDGHPSVNGGCHGPDPIWSPARRHAGPRRRAAPPRATAYCWPLREWWSVSPMVRSNGAGRLGRQGKGREGDGGRGGTLSWDCYDGLGRPSLEARQTSQISRKARLSGTRGTIFFSGHRQYRVPSGRGAKGLGAAQKGEGRAGSGGRGGKERSTAKGAARGWPTRSSRPP